jgi:SCP-2 sterol transfer family
MTLTGAQTVQNGNEHSEFARLKDLTIATKPDIGAAFERMASLLEGSGIEGTVQFRLFEGANQLLFTLAMGKQAVVVRKGGADGDSEAPDLEVIMKIEICWEIAKGAMSPLTAFGRGQIRVRGNYNLGKRMVAHLAGTPGRTDIC